eukprot:1171162-Prorocentrum_minimum.AAC.2
MTSRGVCHSSDCSLVDTYCALKAPGVKFFTAFLLIFLNANRFKLRKLARSIISSHNCSDVRQGSTLQLVAPPIAHPEHRFQSGSQQRGCGGGAGCGYVNDGPTANK